MAEVTLMPKLGADMTEGTVIAWLKNVGDPVRRGEGYLEIETDKSTVEVEAMQGGVLLKTLCQAGDRVPVGEPIAIIGKAGEDISGLTYSRAGGNLQGEKPESSEKVSPEETEMVPVTENRKKSEKEFIRISPLARKTAKALGIDYHAIIGTSASGRIVKKDILAAAAKAVQNKHVSFAEKPAEPRSDETELKLMSGDTVIELSGMRKVIAKRLLQSHTEIPPVTQTTKADVTEFLRFRKMLIGEMGKKYSVNDLILLATAKALKSHPEMLVSYDDGRIIQRSHINLGMAVAVDAGLIVPVIRDADQLGLDRLSDCAKDLADKARDNRLLPEEYKDSTFSVSNLGMFGVESFTPIINQPDAAILGVCAIQNELVMDDENNIASHQIMRLCLTYDHRLIDGAVAARFVCTLRDLLERPVSIVL